VVGVFTTDSAAGRAKFDIRLPRTTRARDGSRPTCSRGKINTFRCRLTATKAISIVAFGREPGDITDGRGGSIVSNFNACFVGGTFKCSGADTSTVLAFVARETIGIFGATGLTATTFVTRASAVAVNAFFPSGAIVITRAAALREGCFFANTFAFARRGVISDTLFVVVAVASAATTLANNSFFAQFLALLDQKHAGGNGGNHEDSQQN
jgi:hypothetical protein